MVGQLEARSVPNLVNGISQQDPSQRRDTQCEAQFDCNNSPRVGAVARNGADVTSYTQGVDHGGAFSYEIIRGTTEHYVVFIDAAGVSVYDLNTGAPCSVTNLLPGGDAYLAIPPGVAAKDNFRVQTVGDFSFFINKNVQGAMLSGSGITPTRPPEALIFFQAGNYVTIFEITVTYLGVNYSFSYQTPDNSAVGNSYYITTNQLAATFYRAMTGTVANANPAAVGTVGAQYAGDPGGSGAGGISALGRTNGTLIAQGFSLAIDGNIIRIWRAGDNNPFTVDCTDGGGNTMVESFQTSVQSFSLLPKFGFPGMVFQILGVEGDTAASSYYVMYQAGGVAGGAWVECPAPGVETLIDPTSFPHAIVCTAVDTFEVRQLTWQPRICGDAVNTAPNIGFIGRLPYDIFYHEGRLAILTDTTCDWTKAKQVFTFYPDTVQAQLPDCPINITLAASDAVALTHKAVKIDESLMLWAQRVQFRVNSGGVNAFQASTIQVPESTMYEWSETGGFAKAGNDLYFGFEADNYAFITRQTYQNAQPQGDIEVTSHVQELIPDGLRRLSVSAMMKMLFVQSSATAQNLVAQNGADNNLYLYQWLAQENSLVQSAWNTWRLPRGAVIWHSIYDQFLFVAYQVGPASTGGMFLLKLPLSTASVDVGQPDYCTRLDFRVSEAQCASITYNAAANTTAIVLPYFTYSANQAPSGSNPLQVVIRTTSAKHSRGQVMDVVAVSPDQAGSAYSPTTVTVEGNITAEQFYVGHQIVSLRQESEFFVRTSAGTIPFDQCQVRAFKVEHTKSGYYRMVVTRGDGTTKTASLLPTSSLQNGFVKVPVDTDTRKLTLQLINDSPFPSRWQTAVWEYEQVQRAPVKLSGMGVPIQ